MLISQKTVWSQILSEKNVVCVGIGNSYALASFLAYYLRLRGGVSYSIKPSELAGNHVGKVVKISQSASGSYSCDYLICQEAKEYSIDKNKCLPIYSECNDDWLDLDYFKSFLDTLAGLESIGIPKLIRNTELRFSKSKLLILVEGSTPFINEFNLATCAKINELNFYAMSMEDFGHGWHQKLYLENDKYEVLILAQNEKSALKERIYDWLNCNGIKYDIINTSNMNDEKGVCFEIFYHYIEILTKWLLAKNINYKKRSLPIRKDNLR